MKKLAIIVAIVLMFSVVVPVTAAPLFSDVPEGNGWPSKEAVEAVAKLAEIGIFKGYPDGTFKGDRAATRWELALVIIRFYSEMEKVHATLATKQELEAAREEAKKAIEDTKTWVNTTFATKEELNAAKTELDGKITAVDQKLDRHIDDNNKWQAAHDEQYAADWKKHNDEYAAYKQEHQAQHQAEWQKHDQEFAAYKQSHDEEYASYKKEVEQKFQQVREDMNKLREELKAEIDALGGRVAKLEEEVPKIDKRVAELERIKFHVTFDSMFISQGFTNAGDATFTGAAGRTAGITGPSLWTNSYMPAVNYKNGRAYTNGTGFTGKAALSVALDVNPRLCAEAIFNAYISQGDQLVDAIWGTPANWLSNVHMAENQLFGGQFQNNTPWTRFTFDTLNLKFYTEDKKPDSKAAYKLQLGALDTGNFDKHIYTGILNPGVMGPKYYGGYGFDLTGKADFLADMHWEVLWTKLPDNNTGNYYPSAFGFNLDWLFESGNFKLNFLRASSGDFGGVAATPGGVAGINGVYTGWINPAGYQVADKPSAADRPIVAANGVMGAFGPQAVTMWGASFNWKFENNFTFNATYGNSKYWPNMQSGYSKDGNAFRVAVGYAPENWDFNLDYLSVEPWYDPMINQMPQNALFGAGVQNTYYRLPDMNYYAFGYALHDTEFLPQNRQGFRLKVGYKLGEDGKVWAEYGSLEQVRSSAFDTKIAAGNMGYAPGYIEPVFGPTAGYDASLNPYEDNKGKSTNWGLGVKYQFPGSNLKMDLCYKDWKFKRDAGLPTGSSYANAEINYVDLGVNGGHIGLAYPVSFNEENKPKFTLKAGYDWTNVKGHYDFFGNTGYWAVASAANGYQYDTVNSQQTAPYLGFDYEVNKDTNWNLNLTFVNTSDGMANGAPAASGAPHAWSWNGMQLSSEVKVKF